MSGDISLYLSFAWFEPYTSRTEQQSSLVGYSRPESPVEKKAWFSTGNNKSLYHVLLTECVRRVESPFILILFLPLFFIGKTVISGPTSKIEFLLFY